MRIGMKMIVMTVACVLTSSGFAHAATIDFDMRNTAEGQDLEDTGSATKGGVTMTATSNGTINAISSRLGINSAGSDDGPSLFDDVNGDNTGVEETFTFSFDFDVTLESIDFTDFGGDDEAILTIGAGSPVTITSSDATNPYLIGTAVSASTSIVLEYNNNGTSNGWGIETVTITAIPAPAALPAGLALLGFAAARRRRR